MSDMRSLITLCFPVSQPLFEDAGTAPVADAATLKANLTAQSASLVKTLGLRWTNDWSNKLMSALKTAQAEHRAEPSNNGQPYDPNFDVWRCAESVFGAGNQFIYVEGELSDDRDNPLAACQLSLAGALYNAKFYNIREVARIAGVLGRFEQNWQRALTRAGGSGQLCPLVAEELGALVPFLLAILTVISR